MFQVLELQAASASAGCALLLSCRRASNGLIQQPAVQATRSHL